MSRQRFAASTRRACLRTGGALAAGLLAGCTFSESGDDPSDSGADGNEDGDANANDQSASNGDEGSEGDDAPSYSASLSPVGSVELDGAPESAFVVFPQYADMAVALGYGDAVNALFSPELADETMNGYYDRLPGVSFDGAADLPDPLANGFDRERLYGLDSDVHLVDPAYMTTQDGWDRSDVDAVDQGVGPWLGNFYSGTHDQPPEEYRDGYEYYTLWEIFEQVAGLFGERDRYEALKAVHSDALSEIEANLPPEDERPTAARVSFIDGTFYALYLDAPGFWQADARPLAPDDVFAGEDWNLWGTLDYEAMVEVDPDVVLNLWGNTTTYDVDETRETIADDPVGSELSAIRNDRFYASGMRYQGPIMNLFQLEMTAKQLYPEQFGEWPGYDAGESYPEIPEDERLFDRERVAEIVTDGA